MPFTFLAVSVVGALFTLNGLRPIRWKYVALPSFSAAWLTTELAAHHLLWQLVATIAFIALGALRDWPGVLALAITVASWCGVAVLVKRSLEAGEVVEQALRDGLGPDYMARIAPELAARYDRSLPWRRLMVPFRMGLPEVERVKDVRYAEGAGRRHLLDVYRHRDRPTGCPVLLQVHGGGWVIGEKRQQAVPLMQHLAARGWVCVAANYRLSPRATFPDHLVDLKRARAWVRSHVAEYGGDPDFVVVTGGSAGGHLSSLLALTANDPEYQPGFEDVDTAVQACVPYYGVYDLVGEVGHPITNETIKFLERTVLKTSRREHPEAFEKASPICRVHNGAPPFLVIHGRDDTLAPIEAARVFVERLRARTAGPVVYAELPGAGHAFDVFPSIRTAHVIRGVERFLDYVYSTHLARVKAEVT
ncbi:MAG: alpha/beta hydrolase [Actinobacteria bacterium]|nr:MAG: alpha/beta hydrolase [Actinomycetota bacterium]